MICMAPSVISQGGVQPAFPTENYPIRIMSMAASASGISGEIWVYQRPGMVAGSNYYCYAKIISKTWVEAANQACTRKGPVESRPNTYAYTYTYGPYDPTTYNFYALISMTPENARRFFGINAEYIPDHNQQSDNILGSLRDEGPNYELASFNLIPGGSVTTGAPSISSSASSGSNPGQGSSSAVPTNPGSGSTGGAATTSGGPGNTNSNNNNNGSGDNGNGGGSSNNSLVIILVVVALVVALLIAGVVGFLIYKKRSSDRFNEELLTLPWKKRGSGMVRPASGVIARTETPPASPSPAPPFMNRAAPPSPVPIKVQPIAPVSPAFNIMAKPAPPPPPASIPIAKSTPPLSVTAPIVQTADVPPPAPRSPPPVSPTPSLMSPVIPASDFNMVDEILAAGAAAAATSSNLTSTSSPSSPPPATSSSAPSASSASPPAMTTSPSASSSASSKPSSSPSTSQALAPQQSYPSVPQPPLGMPMMMPPATSGAYYPGYPAPAGYPYDPNAAAMYQQQYEAWQYQQYQQQQQQQQWAAYSAAQQQQQFEAWRFQQYQQQQQAYGQSGQPGFNVTPMNYGGRRCVLVPIVIYPIERIRIKQYSSADSDLINWRDTTFVNSFYVVWFKQCTFPNVNHVFQFKQFSYLNAFHILRFKPSTLLNTNNGYGLVKGGRVNRFWGKSVENNYSELEHRCGYCETCSYLYT
ncbi:hypothetical protein HDU67_006242 [Dinochytrium kinnereticum]|nr:hypothetical protein HDU67_006242 [Dinochytrium kinnereticum]